MAGWDKEWGKEQRALGTGVCMTDELRFSVPVVRGCLILRLRLRMTLP